MPAASNRPLTVAALLLSMFMAAMEATVVATAMPTVISDLGGLGLYGWVGAAYLLASTVTVPLYGKLADRSGRKPILLTGITLFLVGSLASGFSTSIEQLIAFRALQGIGAGAMQPIVLTVIGDLYTPTERGRVQGFFGAVWGFAGISGPILGGAIVSMISWRWIFWINVPFGILAIATLLVAYREPARPRSERPLDLAGAGAILVASLTLLLAASGVYPLIMIPLAAVSLGLFVFIELRAPDPLLPMTLITRRLIAVATIASFFLGATMMGGLSYLPLHVQGVLGESPTIAGLVIAPMLVGWPIAASVTSRMLARVGYRRPIRIGTVMSAIGFTGLAVLIGLRTPPWTLGAMMFVFGCGMGLANTALLIGVQASVGYEQRGVATATSMFSRTMGGALGVGGLGALLAARLNGRLAPETVSALLDPHGRGDVIAAPEVVEALGNAVTPLFFCAALATVFAVIAVLAQPRDESTKVEPASLGPAAPPEEARSPS